MVSYIARRLGYTVLLVFIVTSITFFLSYVLPSNPARKLAGPHATQEQVTAIEKAMGLNLPLPAQYVRYLVQTLKGDLGTSIETKRPVTRDIGEFFTATLELTTVAMILTVGIGIPLGVMSAVQHNRLADHIARLISLAGVSMPVFLLAMLIQLSVKSFPDIPIASRVAALVSRDSPLRSVTGLYLVDSLLTGNWPFFRSALLHVAAPAITLACPTVVIIMRMVRATMIEVLQLDFVRTARAFGIPERRVIFRHALRNAMLPTLTVIGLSYGYALSGSFLIESIFAWPGLGRYALNAAGEADYPAIMGVAILVTIVYNVVNLLVDLCYGLVDPRMRLT